MTQHLPQEVDVAIVGGGISGMIAAVRLAEDGKRVLVLEKSTEDRYLCNSRLTGGIYHVCRTDIRTEPALLEREIMRVTGGGAHPGLAKAIAGDGLRAVKWMQSEGIRFIKGLYDYQSYMLSPPTITARERQWEGRGGDVMLRTFEERLKSRKGVLQRGARARHLIREGGRVVGLRGTWSDDAPFELRARCVVLADGGFQANPDALRGPISPAPEKLLQRNARTAVGDGMRMVQEIGGALTDLRGFYGHLHLRDALTDDRFWPYGWLDFVVAAGIVVTQAGERFDDEGKGGVHMANAIAGLPDPGGTFAIADQRIWEERGTFQVLPPNPRLVEWGGKFHKAVSLAELASLAGIDSNGLISQVQRYNRAIAEGGCDRLVPARSVAPLEAYPIEKPPFYAFPIVAGITYTMGGVAIDEHGRVLDAERNCIDGLYAVGCTTGGLEGGESKGYVGGLVKSSVTALRAAEHILGVARELP